MKSEKNPFDKLDLVEVNGEPKGVPSGKYIAIPLTDPVLAEQKGRLTKKRKKMNPLFEVLYLEDGSPSAHEAVALMKQALRNFRKSQVKVVRIIHGYGSTGPGGAIKKAIFAPLKELVKSGAITTFIIGEEFKCSNHYAHSLVNKYPFLKRDSDYLHPNLGITIVEL